MAVQTIETLKSYFKAGKFPAQSNYEDLIDTIAAIAEQITPQPQNTGNFLQVDIPNYTGGKYGDIVQHVGPDLYEGDYPRYIHGYIYKCTYAIAPGGVSLWYYRDSNTITSTPNPLSPANSGNFSKYSNIDFGDYSSYKEGGANYYAIALYSPTGGFVSTINPETVSEHFIAKGREDIIEVIKYSSKYYRRTGQRYTNSNVTTESWQEISGSEASSYLFTWERINVQPQGSIIRTIALASCDSDSSYDSFRQNSDYQYSTIVRSNLTPVPIDDFVKYAGLNYLYNDNNYSTTVRSDAVDPFDPNYLQPGGVTNFSAILIIHNAGWVGNGYPKGDYSCYISWQPNGDGYYGDVDSRYTGKQVVVIPYGCSVAFSMCAGYGWQPIGTYTSISLADLQAREDELLNN